MDTPNRIAKMYVNEIFWGLDYNAFPKCTAVDNKMKYENMIVEGNISVQSNCEHHFVVIDGLATVAYIPNKKVLGLSKMNRIVEYFSKRILQYAMEMALNWGQSGPDARGGQGSQHLPPLEPFVAK